MLIQFHVVVKSVEERFETVVQDPEAYGEARSEARAQEATNRISKGWWLVLKNIPVAWELGSTKPDIEPGDRMIVELKKADNGKR